MRTAYYFFIALALSACNNTSAIKSSVSSTPVADTLTHPAPSVPANTLFTQAEAEKILGEPAHLQDSSTSASASSVMWQCSYKANTEDKTGKTGIVYFLVETHNTVAASHNVYTSIYKANANHGVQVLTGVGDEAYFHTDNENFYFIMARKGSKAIRIKVNKTTSHTSRPQFDSVSYNIIARM